MVGYALRYKGLSCLDETNEWSGSDEIYLATTVVATVDGAAAVRVEKHPIGVDYYSDLDAGEQVTGPIAPCWFGAARDLSLVCTLLEHDQGDPNQFRDALVTAAAVASTALGSRTSASGWFDRAIADAVSIALDLGDDLISQEVLNFSRDEVRRQAEGPKRRDRAIEYTAATRHHGQGGEYAVYFDFHHERVEGQLEQPGWRSCPRCQGMHYAGFPDNKGVCPAGGQHAQTGSWAYVMTYGRPAPNQQTGWASCPKCQGLHYAERPGFTGVCPAGGQHEQSGSFSYVVTHDSLAGPNEQVGWAACPKCQGMHYTGLAGVCPAGGRHEQTGSFSYLMSFVR